MATEKPKLFIVFDTTSGDHYFVNKTGIVMIICGEESKNAISLAESMCISGMIDLFQSDSIAEEGNEPNLVLTYRLIFDETSQRAHYEQIMKYVAECEALRQ